MKHLGWAAWAILVPGAVLVLLGIVLLYLGSFTPAASVDPFAFLQLGVTLLVGFYLTHYVAQRTAERGAERKVLIEAAGECRSLANGVIAAYGECCDEPANAGKYLRLLRECKALGWRVWTLEVLLTECGVKKDDSPMKRIETEMHALRRRATSTLPNVPTSEERTSTESAYRDLSLALSRLVIFVNRTH